MPNPFDPSHTPELTDAQRAIIEKCTIPARRAMKMSDAEIIAEVRARGLDLDAEAERIRKLLADAVDRSSRRNDG